jgi:hypothetical protein
MILALAVVVGLIVALARHRQDAFSRIAAIPLRSAWLVIVAVALQLPLLRAPQGPAAGLGLQKGLFLASHLLLLVFVWRNRRLAGVLIVGLGVTCNLVVIAANGGFMPITPETCVKINPGSTMEQWPEGVHYRFSKDLILAQEDTRFWALSDRLVLPPPFPQPTAFSAGDLLIAAGIVVLMQGSRPEELPPEPAVPASSGKGKDRQPGEDRHTGNRPQ